MIDIVNISGKKFLAIEKKDINEMNKNFEENENMQAVHIPLPPNVTFLDLIAEYEDVQLKPFHSYNNIDDKMELDHRIRSMLEQLKHLSSLLEKARDRIADNINSNKIHALKLITEQQDGKEAPLEDDKEKS